MEKSQILVLILMKLSLMEQLYKEELFVEKNQKKLRE
jgi:hypothetical protein